MELYFLTWTNGQSRRVEAPSKEAAINISNNGMPATIDKVEYPSNYELLKIIRRLEEVVKGIDIKVDKLINYVAELGENYEKC